MTVYLCPECEAEHPYGDVIEEAEMNGYPIGDVQEMCPECGHIVTFRRDVAELENEESVD